MTAIGRFERHRQIDWFDQAAVTASRCIVVGAGAVGNEVLKNLALLGVGHLDVFDLDIIEEHNLTRSVLFRAGDVGRPKAEVAAERAAELGGPTVSVVPHHGDCWHTLTLRDLQRATRVYCCVDNFEARIRLSRLCALLDVDLVNTGIDSRYVSVEIFPFSGGEDAACFECSLAPSVYARLARRYSCGGLRRLGLVERQIPTTIVTSSLAGSMAVSMSILRSGEAPDGGRGVAWRWFADSRAGTVSSATLERSPTCPGCSDITGPSVVVPLAREVGAGAGPAELTNCHRTAHLSEKVVVGYRCTTCTDAATVWRLAAECDERLADCPRCGAGCRRLDIRDSFAWGELRRILGNTPLPGKFLGFPGRRGQVLFELEGGCDA